MKSYQFWSLAGFIFFSQAAPDLANLVFGIIAIALVIMYKDE